MNQDHNLQQLAFYRLEYSIDQVRYWLGNSDLENFCFEPYFPATEDPNRPLYLCCFAQNNEGVYIAPYEPDLLAPYPGGVVVLTGPLKLTGSVVPADAMRNLINENEDDNWLLFTPVVDEYRQVYYTIQTLKRTATGDVLGGGTINSNPSPPATSMIAKELN